MGVPLAPKALPAANDVLASIPSGAVVPQHA